MRRFDGTEREFAVMAEKAFVTLPNSYRGEFRVFCQHCTTHWRLSGGDTLQIFSIFKSKTTDPAIPPIGSYHYLLTAICPECFQQMTVWDSKNVKKDGFKSILPLRESLPDTIEELFAQGIPIDDIKNELDNSLDILI